MFESLFGSGVVRFGLRFEVSGLWAYSLNFYQSRCRDRVAKIDLTENVVSIPQGLGQGSGRIDVPCEACARLCWS